jgi:hypothetical protein
MSQRPTAARQRDCGVLTTVALFIVVSKEPPCHTAERVAMPPRRDNGGRVTDLPQSHRPNALFRTALYWERFTVFRDAVGIEPTVEFDATRKLDGGCVVCGRTVKSGDSSTSWENPFRVSISSWPVRQWSERSANLFAEQVSKSCNPANK